MEPIRTAPAPPHSSTSGGIDTRTARTCRRADQRHHQRYELSGHPRCRIGLLEAQIVDVSLIGLAVTASSTLWIGQVYPMELIDSKHRLAFPVLVTRSKLIAVEARDGETSPVYSIGLDFRRAIDDHALEILRFLQERVVVLHPEISVSAHSLGETEFNPAVPCHLVKLSMRAVEVITPWSAATGTPIVVSLKQKRRGRTFFDFRVVSECSGAPGHHRLRLKPVEPGTAARLQLADLIRLQLA